MEFAFFAGDAHVAFCGCLCVFVAGAAHVVFHLGAPADQPAMVAETAKSGVGTLALRHESVRGSMPRWSPKSMTCQSNTP